jgi:hypothetical protein
MMYARNKLPFEAITDWMAGTRGGSDFWVRAEKFVAKRRCGEIQTGLMSVWIMCPSRTDLLPAARDWIEDSDLIE